MQGFLTRAGSARNCRCKTCIDVAKTIVRRSTTANTKAVEGRYRTAFTTLYTSIFATAAVVDAKWKDDRRRELDAQISEAKEAVARLQLENASLEAELGPGILERAGYKRTRTTTESENSTLTETAVEADPIELPTRKQTTDFFEEHGGQHWDVFHREHFRRTTKALTRWDYDMLDLWLRLEMEQDNDAVSMPVDRAEDQEFNVIQLVDYLLLEHDQICAEQKMSSEPTPMRVAIEKLKSTWLPRYQPPAMARAARIQLAEDIVQDIDSNVTGTVERICYNLLTSQSPITLPFYNTLIVHLTRARHHRLAHCVVKSRFTHFKNQDDPTATGVVLYHDMAFGNYAAVHRSAWSLFQQGSEYFAQNGELMLEAIVRALAGIFNVADAVSAFCYGFSSGVNVHPKVLVDLIGLCIWKLDPAPVVMLLRAFTEEQERFEAILKHSHTTQSILLHQINYLLDITNLWQQSLSSSRELKQRLQEYDLNPEAFRQFRSMITRLDVERQCNQIDHTIRRINNKLGLGNGGMPTSPAKLQTRFERALIEAAGFDSHMKAAMPRSWIQKKSQLANPGLTKKVLRNAKYGKKKPLKQGMADVEPVWTREDYEAARASLRMVVRAKESAAEAEGQGVFDVSAREGTSLDVSPKATPGLPLQSYSLPTGLPLENPTPGFPVGGTLDILRPRQASAAQWGPVHGGYEYGREEQRAGALHG